MEKEPISQGEISYPENLTEGDIQLINKQCEYQGATSKEKIEGFARAYLEAKTLALDKDELRVLSQEGAEELILRWAAIIEERNSQGYRQTPVTFRGGAKGLDAPLIPRAMNGFCEMFSNYLETATEDERFNSSTIYREFETIHPFEDGNGRVGDLLWKMMETRKNGVWPEELPPDLFDNSRG